MKLAALALCLLAACAAPAPRAVHRVQFAPGSTHAQLERVVRTYEERIGFGKHDAEFEVDAQAATVVVKTPVVDERSMQLLLGSMCDLRFLPQATEEFLAAKNTTLAAERARFDAWRGKHAEEPLAAFDELARDAGGPIAGTLWRRDPTKGEYVLLVLPEEKRFRFGHDDLAEVGFCTDAMGYPAVSFELSKERQKDFGDWTASILGQGMAIVLDDEVLVLASVRSRLPGGGIIEGGSNGYTKLEVQTLVAILRSPRLPLKPLSVTLESAEKPR